MMHSEAPSLNKEVSMQSKFKNFERKPYEAAVWALLDAVSNLGFRPAGKRSSKSLRPMPDIQLEFASRIEDILSELEFKESEGSDDDQLSMTLILEDGVSKRFKQSARKSLMSVLKKRRETVPRDRPLNMEYIQEILVYWAGTLVLRGWSGVSDYRVITALKSEAIWLSHELGYDLPSKRVLTCPFIMEWQDHEYWESVCILDGIPLGRIEVIRKERERYKCAKGCPGRIGEISCKQVDLQMTA
ncbi:MAG: hypothetical protein ACYCY6_01310 [Minisyncoccota bacterium]